MLFFSSVCLAQTPEEIAKILSETNVTELNSLSSSFESVYQQNKSAALQMAAAKGWQIVYTTPEGNLAELQGVDDFGNPKYYLTENIEASISTRTNLLNAGGSTGYNLDGLNMIGYVWDGGHARVSHQEYDGSGGTNRVTIEDTATEGGTNLSSHAGHVTGTIAASGVIANAKGMAPKSRVKGYKWNSDISEATTAAANGMLVSNHSYGYNSSLLSSPYWFGSYGSDARSWDLIMNNAPYYLMVKAAGNDGLNSYNSTPLNPSLPQYDKLTGNATSKNNLVVANANDASIDSNGNLVSVTIASSSSQGPTDDLRIKPDISGNGSSLYSSVESSDSSYGIKSGTSMASPNVSGTLLLLQEHANKVNGNYLKAATLKGLVLHTADDFGPTGPDAITGWGLLNAKKAAETISNNNNKSVIKELTLTQGQTYTLIVSSWGIGPLKASISWNDPAGTATTVVNSNIARLVNDLDLRITKGTSTFLPWRLTGVNTNALGDNTKDPFERVDVNNPIYDNYTITVTHKGTLLGGSQKFSLIITGINSSCIYSIPSYATVNNGIVDVLQASNNITHTGTIMSGGVGIYHAGSFVLLQNGFCAKSGSVLKAYIEGCTGSYVSKVAGLKDEDFEKEELNKDLLNDNEIVLYPNPSSNQITIDSKNSNINSIKVIGLDGKIMINKQMMNVSSIDIDIDHLEKGVYIVEIETIQNVRETKKLIKY